jgi:L-2,4-diaminobutyrate decarboxylase
MTSDGSRRFAHELVDLVFDHRDSDDFEPVHGPQLNILCFRRRGLDNEQTAALRERLVRGGRAWITTTVLRGERVLRVTMMNPRTTERHVDAMLDELRRLS